VNIIFFTKLFYDVHFSFHYQHGRQVEGVTIIESSLSTRHGDPLGDPLGGPLFALTHYLTFLKTITRAPNYIFPSLVDHTHIVRPVNEIIHVFDHLLTQLTLVGLRFKASKFKLWNPSRISPCIEIPQGSTLVTNGLCILDVQMAS
jgi:hypothetical protein